RMGPWPTVFGAERTMKEDTPSTPAVGFSFDLKAQYSGNELCNKMAGRLLNWAGVRDPNDISLATTRILEIVNSGGVDREFLKWCRSYPTSAALNSIDKPWANLIFGSVALAIYSDTAVRLKVEQNQLVGVFGEIGVRVDGLKCAYNGRLLEKREAENL